AEATAGKKGEAQRDGGGETRSAPANQPSLPNEIAVYVPAGQSRVVKLPRVDESLAADRIVLRGDDPPFDNSFFVVPPRKQNAAILYVGGDRAGDTRGLLYYLKLAVVNDPLRQVDVRRADATAGPPEFGEPAPRLMVVTQSISPPWQEAC